MKVEDGAFIVLKGSTCAPTKDGWVPESRRNALIKDNILITNVDCNSPSTAGWIVLGGPNNGWFVWNDSSDQPIDVYRK